MTSSPQEPQQPPAAPASSRDNNRVAGVLLLLLALVYASQIPNITLDQWAQDEAVTARTLPLMLAGGLMIGSALLIFAPRRKRNASTGDDDVGAGPDATEGDPANDRVAAAVPAPDRPFVRGRRIALLLLAMLLFALAVPRLGLWPSSAAFLIAGMLVMGERRWGRLLGAALGATLLFYLLLGTVLGIYVSPGQWWT